MKVRALKAFRDLVEKKDRRAGEVFEASEERVKKIQETLPEWIEIVDEKPAKTKEKSEQAKQEKPAAKTVKKS